MQSIVLNLINIIRFAINRTLKKDFIENSNNCIGRDCSEVSHILVVKMKRF